MPRYCVACSCKYRGGQAVKDNRRLSFYPFPLQNKERLRQWLLNMKREQWVPTKHQFLCSDHFTPDCFDVRWGIRYLKHTAVPTIFSTAGIIQERNNSKCKFRKRKDAVDQSVTNQENCCSDGTLKIIPEVESMMSEEPKESENKCSTIFTRHIQRNKHASLQTGESENKIRPECQLENSSQNIKSVVGITAKTDLFEMCSLSQHIVKSTDASVAEGCEQLNTKVQPVAPLVSEDQPSEIADCGVRLDSNVSFISLQNNDNSVTSSVITQTSEQFSQTDDSVITVILSDSSEDIAESACTLLTNHHFESGDQMETDAVCFSESSGVDSLQIEHSYFRQGADVDYLWQKIAKLHAKVTLLELQEKKTLARLKSLETLIEQLRQENVISKEKLLESYYAAFEMASV